MERIGDHCHQYEQRQHHQHHQHICPLPHDEHISTVAFQSLDTVRALHQTVVSLRKALEEAHREIDTLKKRINISVDIEEGKKYRRDESNENLTKITFDEANIDAHKGHDETNLIKTSETLQSNRSDSILHKSSQPFDDFIEKRASLLNFGESATTQRRWSSSNKKTKSTKAQHQEIHTTKVVVKPNRSEKSQSKEELAEPIKRNRQMASKIDVKIKLTSNFKIDGSESSSEATGDTNSAATVTPRESGTDSTSERDNVNVETRESVRVDGNNQGISIVKTSTEQIQIEDASLDSAGTDGIENDDAGNEAAGGIDDDEVFFDEAVPSTSKVDGATAIIIDPSSPHRSSCDNQEEVDDIELIFSSDDKEFPQEDLVSISYYEPWQMCGQSGTPILVNFNNISSDNEGGADAVDNVDSREKLSPSPSPIDPDQFYNAIKENVAQQQYSLESCDSLSLGDNVKRSMDKDGEERGNNDDGIRRDESFDTFEPNGIASAMGRRWTNYNVFQETDISKIGIAEESVLDKGRRNTCPNPAAYRPIMHREAIGRFLNNNADKSRIRNGNVKAQGIDSNIVLRCPLAVKFARNARTHLMANNNNRSPRQMPIESNTGGPKRSSSAQTDISALPEHWRSESHLASGLLGNGFFTLPSKFVPAPESNFCKLPLKVSEKTREARRVLLSDINFTSMVPELSRSADHLCHGEEQQNIENNNATANTGTNVYYKGALLKTPDYGNRGITPSMSLTSPGVSQWTVNENSYGTQTTQTDNYWSVQHADSFDSCKSYSIGSKISFGKHHRSRSCPSVRCALCKHRHHGGIKMSESMHYTPRVTFQEANTTSVRGSLPDLRPDCACGCPRSRIHARHHALRYGDSCGSTESILDEADDFLRESIDGVLLNDVEPSNASGTTLKTATRRCSENDIKKDFSPSKQTLPFLPKSSKCLKPGHLAKVIAKNGRVVIGRVRYVGPIASSSATANAADAESEMYVGLQLPNKIGDCNGSYEGRKFFDCDPQHGIFVPFKKIVMAWTS